jgi:hypothetical protein
MKARVCEKLSLQLRQVEHKSQMQAKSFKATVHKIYLFPN